MRCFTVCLLILALFTIPLSAQTGVAKYAGEFMSTGFGGRALAMGGAYAAVAGDVSAAYWNPAGLMQLQYPELGLMHEQRYGLLTYNYGGVAWPFGPKYTLALSVTRLGVDDISDTRNAFVDLNGNGQFDPDERPDYSKITSFSAVDWVAYLTYSFRGTDDLSLGVNMKLIRRDLAEESAMGVGFDVGALYFVTPRFSVGANLQDITTTLMAWTTGRNELVSPTFKIGGAYKFDLLGGTIMPAVDFDLMGENRKTASLFSVGPVSVNPRVGLEYGFRDLFAIRAGMNNFSETPQVAFGAGVHLPKLYLDYAFGQSPFTTGFGFDKAAHRISVRLMLEEKKFSRPSN